MRFNAIKCAFDNEDFACPVPYEAALPMIIADDLIVGLLALQDAEKSALTEPECGYAMSGHVWEPKCGRGDAAAGSWAEAVMGSR